MDGSFPLGPSAPARDSVSLLHSPGTPWPALHPSALALRLACGFGLASPLLTLPIMQLALHSARDQPPSASLSCRPRRSLGPSFLPYRQPRAPPAASHLPLGLAQTRASHTRPRRPPTAELSPRIALARSLSPASPRAASIAAQRTPPTGPALGAAPVSDGLVFAPQSRPLRPGQPQWHPSLGWPGPLCPHLATASSASDAQPHTRPAQSRSCHVPSDRAGPRGSPRLGRPGRPDSGLRQLKSPHGEDMSLCSNSGRASAAPSRYHYDGRSSGVQPRRIAPGPGRNPPRVRASTSPSLARRPASLLDPIASPSSEGTRRDIGGAGGEGPPQPLRRLPSGDPWGSSPLGGSSFTPRVTRGVDGS